MKIIAKAIELFAYLGAGCTSCVGLYQPKLPKELE